MTQYQLNIAIDNRGLNALYANGLRVCLMRIVSGVPIVWQSFQPYQQNVITWDELRVYGSQTVPGEGAQLVVWADRVVMGEMTTYVLTDAGWQTQTGGVAGTNAVVVMNQQPEQTVGLLQYATVNDDRRYAPISAMTHSNGVPALLVPSNDLFLFTSRLATNGTVAIPPPATALAVSFSGAHPVANVIFDDEAGVFRLQP